MAIPRLPVFARAILISLTGLFLLDSMGAVVKHLGDSYPVQQLSMFRNLFGLVPLAIILLASRQWHATGRNIRIRQWKLALGRGLLVTLAQFCFYLSVVKLAFATASTLVFTGPLFVTALSVPLLGERVGPWRWLAVGIGFSGVVVIMRPGGDAFTLYALLPVCAAFAYALTAVSVRLITEAVPSVVINLYSHVGALIGSTVLMLATSGYHPVASIEDWAWIVGLGMLGGIGVLCLIIAYRMTRPSNLAPFDYFGILFAFGLGWVFFGEAPFETLFPGVLLIVGGGGMIIWRERRAAARLRWTEAHK
jgi:drug/metabolite transporter (DMT)-like permease